MWKDKVKLNEMFKFCEIPRTRKEIQKEFNLTPIQSWHCCRYLMKLSSDMIVEKNIGITSRAYHFKTRKTTLENLEN